MDLKSTLRRFEVAFNMEVYWYQRSQEMSSHHGLFFNKERQELLLSSQLDVSLDAAWNCHLQPLPRMQPQLMEGDFH